MRGPMHTITLPETGAGTEHHFHNPLDTSGKAGHRTTVSSRTCTEDSCLMEPQLFRVRPCAAIGRHRQP